MIKKISNSQFTIIFFLTGCFTVLDYIPIFSVKVSPPTMLIGDLVAFFIKLFLLIPFFILNKKYPEHNFIDVCYEKIKPFGFILSIIYFLASIGTMIGVTVGFTYFMTSSLYHDINSFFIVFTIILIAFFSVKTGIEGFARICVIILIYFLASTIIFGVISSKSFNILNITPLNTNELLDTKNWVFELLAKSSELFAFMILFKTALGSPKKSYFIFTVCCFLFLEFTNIYLIGILGEYGLSQTFPYYSLACSIDFSIFSRLDAIHMILWILITFVRLSVFFFAAKESIKVILPKKTHRFIEYGIFIIVITLSGIIGSSLKMIKFTGYSKPFVLLCLVTVIPILAIILLKIKEKRNEKN